MPRSARRSDLDDGGVDVKHEAAPFVTAERLQTSARTSGVIALIMR